jgi:hypothetical protein
MSDLKKLYLDIHNKMKSEHGYSAKALGGSQQSKRIRFEVLTKCMGPSVTKLKILDVGSGLAHLNSFLVDKGFEIDYTGIEINSSFIEQSKVAFPEANFVHGDVNKLLDSDELYDYSFASGIYNLGDKTKTQNAFISDFNIILSKTKIAAAVNFLSSNSQNQDNVSVYHKSSEIISLVEKHFSTRYELYHNYLPNDFTIIIWK